MVPKNGMRPVHPGEILRDDLEALSMSANALSKAPAVPVNRITAILHGQAGRDPGHHVAAGAVFRDDAAVVAEPAADLRAAASRDRGGPPHHRERPAAGHSGIGGFLPRAQRARLAAPSGDQSRRGTRSTR